MTARINGMDKNVYFNPFCETCNSNKVRIYSLFIVDASTNTTLTVQGISQKRIDCDAYMMYAIDTLIIFCTDDKR